MRRPPGQKARRDILCEFSDGMAKTDNHAVQRTRLSEDQTAESLDIELDGLAVVAISLGVGSSR